MASIESKLQYDITSENDAESLLGPAATRVARYAAAIAMTPMTNSSPIAQMLATSSTASE